MDIRPNIVVCPKCDESFIHNRVNGIALLEIVQRVESLKNQHCRLTLNTIERELQTLPPAVRKAVLDGYSELARDVQAALGFGLEAE